MKNYEDDLLYNYDLHCELDPKKLTKLLKNKVDTPMPETELTLDDCILNNMMSLPIPRVKNEILIKAIQALSTLGHGSKGHRRFDKAYPNLTIIDILKSCYRQNPKFFPFKDDELRNEVFSISSKIKKTLENLVKIETGIMDINNSSYYDYQTRQLSWKNSLDNTTPFNLRILEKEIINSPLAVLKGFYIMSQADSKKYREMTMEMFPENFEGKKLNIGYGNCHIADATILKKLNINIRDLSDKTPSSKILKEYKKIGLILDNRELSKNAEHISIFLREREDLGICDDATFIAISYIVALNLGSKFKDYGRYPNILNNPENYAVDAYFGAMLADALDTGDKIMLPVYNQGYDEIVGIQINEMYKSLTGKDLATDEEICKAIYLGAKNNFPKIKISDSVNNLQTEINGVSPASAHLHFIRTGEGKKEISFGFEKMYSQYFYGHQRDRIKYARRKGIL